MNPIKEYLQGFSQRAGSAVFLSTVFSRGFSFLGSWMALKLIDHKELGVILFAYSIIQFLIPIAGMGLHQSLIRYGALLKTDDEKKQLFNYVLKKGTISSLVLIGFLLIIGNFIPFNFEDTYIYFASLSICIITFFLLEIVKVQFRLRHQNKLFALSDFSHSLILLVLISLLSYYFKGNGYVAALVISPLLAAILFVGKLNLDFKIRIKLSVTDAKFWRYGIFGGLSNVVTQLLFLIDMILIGYLINDSIAVTNYRYVSIIPFSLLFLPRVFISTDFVAFTEKINNRKYIANYTRNYLVFFSLISLVLVLITLLFSHDILKIFGEEYKQFVDSFQILMIGIVGIYILRSIYGNLLSSIGKIEWNYFIVSFAIVLNLISNYFLIPKYGIKGAAITSAVLMWTTGILSWLCFLYFYRRLEAD